MPGYWATKRRRSFRYPNAKRAKTRALRSLGDTTAKKEYDGDTVESRVMPRSKATMFPKALQLTMEHWMSLNPSAATSGAAVYDQLGYFSPWNLNDMSGTLFDDYEFPVGLSDLAGSTKIYNKAKIFCSLITIEARYPMVTSSGDMNTFGQEGLVVVAYVHSPKDGGTSTSPASEFDGANMDPELLYNKDLVTKQWQLRTLRPMLATNIATQRAPSVKFQFCVYYPDACGVSRDDYVADTGNQFDMDVNTTADATTGSWIDVSSIVPADMPQIHMAYCSKNGTNLSVGDRLIITAKVKNTVMFYDKNVST